MKINKSVRFDPKMLSRVKKEGVDLSRLCRNSLEMYKLLDKFLDQVNGLYTLDPTYLDEVGYVLQKVRGME